MNTRQFGSQYLHNLKRSFDFEYMGDNISEFTFVAYLISPITHTIGALVKTIIDAKTRNPQPQDSIDETIDNINRLDQEGMVHLLNQIDAAEPQSSSSFKLLQNLRATNQDIPRQLAEIIQQERDTQAQKQLGGDTAITMTQYGKEYALSIPLTPENQSELDIRLEEGKLNLDTVRLDNRKALISSYLGKEKNNGKNLHQIIMGMFRTQSEQVEGFEVHSTENGRPSII